MPPVGRSPQTSIDGRPPNRRARHDHRQQRDDGKRIFERALRRALPCHTPRPVNPPVRMLASPSSPKVTGADRAPSPHATERGPHTLPASTLATRTTLCSPSSVPTSTTSHQASPLLTKAPHIAVHIEVAARAEYHAAHIRIGVNTRSAATGRSPRSVQYTIAVVASPSSLPPSPCGRSSKNERAELSLPGPSKAPHMCCKSLPFVPPVPASSVPPSLSVPPSSPTPSLPPAPPSSPAADSAPSSNDLSSAASPELGDPPPSASAWQARAATIAKPTQARNAQLHGPRARTRGSHAPSRGPRRGRRESRARRREPHARRFPTGR